MIVSKQIVFLLSPSPIIHSISPYTLCATEKMARILKKAKMQFSFHFSCLSERLVTEDGKVMGPSPHTSRGKQAPVTPETTVLPHSVITSTQVRNTNPLSVANHALRHNTCKAEAQVFSLNTETSKNRQGSVDYFLLPTVKHRFVISLRVGGNFGTQLKQDQTPNCK